MQYELAMQHPEEISPFEETPGTGREAMWAEQLQHAEDYSDSAASDDWKADWFKALGEPPSEQETFWNTSHKDWVKYFEQVKARKVPEPILGKPYGLTETERNDSRAAPLQAGRSMRDHVREQEEDHDETWRQSSPLHGSSSGSPTSESQSDRELSMLGLGELRGRHRKAQVHYDVSVVVKKLALNSEERAAKRLAQIKYVLDNVERDRGASRTAYALPTPKQSGPSSSSGAAPKAGPHAPPTKAPPTIPPKAAPPCLPIRAEFDGLCHRCNKTIYVGELISKVPGSTWKHHHYCKDKTPSESSSISISTDSDKHPPRAFTDRVDWRKRRGAHQQGTRKHLEASQVPVERKLSRTRSTTS